MLFKVLVLLVKKENKEDKKMLTFTKEIGAANEEQACQFARNALEGFLADDILVHTEVINDEEEEE